MSVKHHPHLPRLRPHFPRRPTVLDALSNGAALPPVVVATTATAPMPFHLEWVCVHLLVKVADGWSLEAIDFAIECRMCEGWVGPGAAR